MFVQRYSPDALAASRLISISPFNRPSFGYPRQRVLERNLPVFFSETERCQLKRSSCQISVESERFQARRYVKRTRETISITLTRLSRATRIISRFSLGFRFFFPAKVGTSRWQLSEK